MESDSDSEMGIAKKNKLDLQSDDEWTAESEEDKLGGRSDVIQRAFSHATMTSNGSNQKSSIASGGLQSQLQKIGQSTMVTEKGLVKVDPKQMPNLTSGIYVMSKKDGIIKLDSSPGGKIGLKNAPTSGVLMVQNRADGSLVRRQIISASPANSAISRIIKQVDGSQVVTQMKVVSKASPLKPGQVKSL